MSNPPAPADAPRREPHCPVCGEANRCAPAASGSFDTPCWCSGMRIGAQALGRVPEARRGLACLCARCATEAA